MSRIEKLKDRLRSRPRDFTWSELVRLLSAYGYKEVDGRGSRKCFDGKGLPRIRLHAPHPGNELKGYQVDYIVELLKQNGLL
jgi:predicted RNA binding protein YcfA (HicA-like mRNA interferase family)